MLHIPEALEALGRSVLDIRRLTPEIVRFQQQIPEAEVGILYSPASLYCDKGYPSSLRQYHTMLSNLDTPIRFISERQLEGDKFGKIKLLVIPKAAFIPAGTVDALRRFTKQGGKIAAAEGALQNDPYGDPLPPLETMWKLDDKTLNPVVLDRLLTESGISRSGAAERSPAGAGRTAQHTYRTGQSIFFMRSITDRPQKCSLNSKGNCSIRQWS